MRRLRFVHGVFVLAITGNWEASIDGEVGKEVPVT